MLLMLRTDESRLVALLFGDLGEGELLAGETSGSCSENKRTNAAISKNAC